MRSVRLLRSIAAIWLACQLGAVSVAALALCCPSGEPGKICPMHQAKPAESTCQMRAGCEPTDAALVALTIGLGDLQHLSTSFVPLQSLDRVAALAPPAMSRADRPDAPPPKA
jgi:hypothetical protein